MKNKDIQFFFNRPDRSVNSGRITDISNGKYSDSFSIEAATEQDLDAFLREFEATEVSASVVVPASGRPVDPPPLKWSAVMVKKTEEPHGEQATEAGRDCLEVATG